MSLSNGGDISKSDVVLFLACILLGGITGEEHYIDNIALKLVSVNVRQIINFIGL